MIIKVTWKKSLLFWISGNPFTIFLTMCNIEDRIFYGIFSFFLSLSFFIMSNPSASVFQNVTWSAPVAVFLIHVDSHLSKVFSSRIHLFLRGTKCHKYQMFMLLICCQSLIFPSNKCNNIYWIEYSPTYFPLLRIY